MNAKKIYKIINRAHRAVHHATPENFDIIIGHKRLMAVGEEMLIKENYTALYYKIALQIENSVRIARVQPFHNVIGNRRGNTYNTHLINNISPIVRPMFKPVKKWS